MCYCYSQPIIYSRDCWCRPSRESSLPCCGWRQRVTLFLWWLVLRVCQGIDIKCMRSFSKLLHTGHLKPGRKSCWPPPASSPLQKRQTLLRGWYTEANPPLSAEQWMASWRASMANTQAQSSGQDPQCLWMTALETLSAEELLIVVHDEKMARGGWWNFSQSWHWCLVQSTRE